MRGTTTHTREAQMSMCSYVYALVQPNKHTHLQNYTHAHAHTYAKSGCIPEPPIQCQCSVLSPPTSGWSPCQFTCQSWTSRALSAPERPPTPPPIHTHCVTQGQGGFTHVPVPSLPSIARCHPCVQSSTTHILQATHSVTATFVRGYFSSHLEEC